MSRLSQPWFSVLLLVAIVATTAVAWAHRSDQASESPQQRSATVNMIRRLGVAVKYDDQQRRQQTSPQIFGLKRATDDNRLK
jgi:hypothetical protein